MSYQIRLAPTAEEEIAHVLRWTNEAFGETQHDNYLKLIVGALERIAADPLNSPSQDRGDLYPNARTLHIARPGQGARHYFLYRVNADQIIEIARFLHDAMDLPRHLPKEWQDRG